MPRKARITPAKLIRLRKRFETCEAFEVELESRGFKRIGAGCWRNVYKHPQTNFVIKVGGSRHNNREKIMSRLLPKRYVAKVLAHHEDVLIQKFIKGEKCKHVWKCPNRPEVLTVLEDYHNHNHFHVGKSYRPVVFDLAE